MSRTRVEPAFSLMPRGDLKTQTLDFLDTFFQENPDDVLTVTMTVTRQSVRDFRNKKRTGLASFRGEPRKRRA